MRRMAAAEAIAVRMDSTDMAACAQTCPGLTCLLGHLLHHREFGPTNGGQGVPTRPLYHAVMYCNEMAYALMGCRKLADSKPHTL